MRMRQRLVRSLVATAAGASLSLPGGAAAQVAEPCPPRQPSDRPPGQPTTAAPGQPSGRPPQYPPGKCQLQLSRSVVAVGQSLTVSGAGFAPGSRVDLTVSRHLLAAALAGPDGRFEQDVAVAPEVPPGPHVLTAAGSSPPGGEQVLSALLTVVAPRGGGSPGGPGGDLLDAAGRGPHAADRLPRTGSSGPLAEAVVGLALVVAGTAAVLLARRRPGSICQDP